MGRKTFESVIALKVLTVGGSALACAAAFAPEESHIGGGPELYDQVIERVDRLYLTLFNDDQEGETQFPDFESAFTEVCRHGVREHQGLEYEWVDYVRRAAARDVERTR